MSTFDTNLPSSADAAMNNDENRWSYFSKKFSRLLEEKEMTLYRLEEDTRHREIKLRSSNMSKIKAGKKRPTDDTLKALSEHPALGVTFEELKGWRAIDEVGLEAIFEASKTSVLDSITANAVEMARKSYVEGIELVPCKFLLKEERLMPIALMEKKDEFSVLPFLDTYPKDVFCIKVMDNSKWPPISQGAEVLVCKAQGFNHKGWYLISQDKLADSEPAESSSFKINFCEFDEKTSRLTVFNHHDAVISVKDFDFSNYVIYEILVYRVIKDFSPEKNSSRAEVQSTQFGKK